MDKITYVYMYSSVWNASLEKNVYLHSDEKPVLSLKRKTTCYSIAPIYIDKFKPTFIKCALKYDTIFLQHGVWEHSFQSTKTIIWSYQIYNVNRFMITNTWWAEHCTYPSIMFAVRQGLTVTIVIMWQLLIYYLVPRDCDGSLAIPSAAISDLRATLW